MVDTFKEPVRLVVRRFTSDTTHVADVKKMGYGTAFGKVYRKPDPSTVALCGVKITDGVAMKAGAKVRCSACRHLSKEN